MENPPITIGLIVITCIISFIGFNNDKVISDFLMWPYMVKRKNQWYRFLTSGFLHGDLVHIIFNMFTLYMFGQFVESHCAQLFGKWMYPVLYFGGMIFADIPGYLRNKDDYNQRSLGASGAVSSVVFAGILFYPTVKMGFFIIPPIIPAYIFGPLYLLYCVYAAKQGQDNIDHRAHLWGAVFGFFFPLALQPELFRQMLNSITGVS